MGCFFIIVIRFFFTCIDSKIKIFFYLDKFSKFRIFKDNNTNTKTEAKKKNKKYRSEIRNVSQVFGLFQFKKSDK